MPLLGELPSNPSVGPTPSQSATARALTMALDIRIGRLLALGARMCHSAIHRRTHLLGVFPQGPRARMVFARLPVAFTRRKLRVGQFHVERALLGIELDDVA